MQGLGLARKKRASASFVRERKLMWKENKPAVVGPTAIVGRGWASHGMQASVGPVWFCMGPGLGGLLNLAGLKKKPNGPHWVQMDSRPIQKKNDERSK